MKLLFPLLVLAALPACAGKSPPDPSPAAKPEPPPAKSAPSADPPPLVELTSGRAPGGRGLQASSQTAFIFAKPWIDDALQIRDAAKRDAAVETVRAAIQSPHALQAHAGLVAFNQMRPAAFDKKSFRPIILPHLAAEDSWMRVSAMYALDAAGREDGDLQLILAAVEGVSGPAKNGLVHVIATYSGGNLTGAAGDAVLKLISSDERLDVRQSFSGLWGTRVSPAIEKRLLDVANAPDWDNAHDALYFGLSTLRDKSEAVVDRLIDALADPDANNSGRALWGLGQGVPEALQPKVADAMVQLFEARSDPQTRTGSLRLLRQYGVERHAIALEKLADAAAADAELKRVLLGTAAEIRQRAAAAK
jgi:hypothetical protein